MSIHSVSTEVEGQGFDAREDPDGEETISRHVQPQSSSPSSAQAVTETVKVPNWILNDTTMEVVFNDRATQQITEFQIDRVGVSTIKEKKLAILNQKSLVNLIHLSLSFTILGEYC